MKAAGTTGAISSTCGFFLKGPMTCLWRVTYGSQLLSICLRSMAGGGQLLKNPSHPIPPPLLRLVQYFAYTYLSAQANLSCCSIANILNLDTSYPQDRPVQKIGILLATNIFAHSDRLNATIKGFGRSGRAIVLAARQPKGSDQEMFNVCAINGLATLIRPNIRRFGKLHHV